MLIPPASVYREDACFTKCHQVLGKICLPPAKGSLQMANARFFLSNGKQDLKAWNWAD